MQLARRIAQRANAVCQAEWRKRSLVIGASADYDHKNGRNHFARILCLSKTTHFWSHLAPVVWSPDPPIPAERNSPFERIQRNLPRLFKRWTIPFIITLKFIYIWYMFFLFSAVEGIYSRVLRILRLQIWPYVYQDKKWKGNYIYIQNTQIYIFI